MRYFHCLLIFLCLAACKHTTTQTTNASSSILASPNIAPLTQAINADTAKADAWYRRGLALHKMGQDSLALNDWYVAARLDSNRAEYASAIGDLLFEHKDVKTATVW